MQAALHATCTGTWCYTNLTQTSRKRLLQATSTVAGDEDAPGADGPAPPPHVLRKLAKQQQFMQSEA